MRHILTASRTASARQRGEGLLDGDRDGFLAAFRDGATSFTMAAASCDFCCSVRPGKSFTTT